MAIDTAFKVHDQENQSGAIEFEPLLNQDDKAGEEVDCHTSSPTERPRIGEIPSVHKPGYGNWMWAEQQCARRCGFTIAEAKLVQDAYELYHDRGDPIAFIIGGLGPLLDMVFKEEEENSKQEENHTSDKWKLKLHPTAAFAKEVERIVHKSPGFVDSMATNPYADLTWRGMKFLSNDCREGHESRFKLMETLFKLLPIVMETFELNQQKSTLLQKESEGFMGRGATISIQNTLSTEQPQKPDSGRASGSVEVGKRIQLENTEAGNLAWETAKSDPSRLSGKEQFETLKRALKAGHFDLTKLDKKKFKDVIQELLSSRSLSQMHRRAALCYIIVGWFPRGSLDPKEKLLVVSDEADLFTSMRKAIRSVRGWRRYISLKSLHSFGLYKCDIPRGAHVKISLSAQERSILSHFIVAYKASHRHPDADVAKAWAAWVQKELNAKNLIMSEGKYSLELIYSWSAVRLSVAVITPTLFSFAVGLGYMIKTGDVSTAWTISSYIVTAAGALVALLAILGSLKDS